MALDFQPSPIGDPKSDTVDLNKYAETGSELAKDMNKAAANMFGVDVAYFRSIPNENSEDVIYMNYTLLNVEDCPKNLKVMFQDAGYLAGDYTITLYEMNYNVPVQIQIDCKTWFEAYGPGTMPQRFDLLYIPILHKIYEVDSTNQVFGFMEQLTHFNVVLKKYNPKEFRKETASLAETIDDYTTSIEELFGDKIETEVADITDVNQTDMYNSTRMDDFKYFSQTRCRVFEENRKSFYKFNPTADFDIRSFDPTKRDAYAVEYKTGLNIDTDKESLLFTTLFKYVNKSEVKISKVKEITFGKNFVDPNADKVPLKEVIIKCSLKDIPDNIVFGDKIVSDTHVELRFKEINHDTNSLVCYVRYIDFINEEKQLKEIKSLLVQDEINQSLIAGINIDSALFGLNISISNPRNINIVLGKAKTSVELVKALKDDQWYGLAVLLDKNGNSKLWIYTVLSFGDTMTIRKFEYHDIDIKIEDSYSMDRLGLVGSYLSQSDIRLYKLPKHKAQNLTEKQVKLDLTNMNTENNSYSIVNDDCMILANKLNVFVGKHK